MTKCSRILVVCGLFCTTMVVTAAYAFTTTPQGSTPPTCTSVSPSTATGTVCSTSKSEEEGEEKDDHQTPTPTTPRITPKEAQDAALAAYPGGTIVGTPKLENEDGTSAYEVHVTAKTGEQHEVKVDATTGKVLQSEDDDEEENDGAIDGADDK